MISALYHNLPPNTEQLLRLAMERGLARGTGKATLFFRADDIGVPGKQFTSLMELFRKQRLPLCLAVVPCWLTPSRFRKLQQLSGKNSSQWCWHQHGWLHRNHEKTGKKQEFGPGRSEAKQLTDLRHGKERLGSLMGNEFSPFFTPPWNRCSLETLHGLQNLGFQAVSRSRQAKPPAPPGLPDFQVNIDLHTRKEPDPATDLKALLTELEEGIASGRGGIMIHHQRMNPAAFHFLAILLDLAVSLPGLHSVRFQDCS